MAKHSFKTLLFLLLALSCKEKRDQQSAKTEAHTNKVKLLIDQRDSIDLHFAFDNQKDTFQNVLNGYTYQFQLNGVDLRAWRARYGDLPDRAILDSDQCIVVEKLVSGRWQPDISPRFFNERAPYGIKFNDVNLDGLNDFTFVMNGQIYATFFDLQTQQLDSTYVGLFISTPYHFVDSSKKIFYDRVDVVDGYTSRWSTLSKFVGKAAVPIYRLGIYADTIGKNRKIDLSKYNPNADSRLDEWRRITLLTPSDDFYMKDSIPYWRKNYKRLLKEY